MRTRQGKRIAGAIAASLLCAAAAAQDSARGLEGTSARGLEGTEDRRDWAVYADVVYTASGKPLEDAVVRVEGGKIRAISGGASFSGAGNALQAVVVTAGMIDASARITKGWHSVEQSREVAPDVRVSLALDPFDEAWASLARSGVTTALAAPPDDDVIGGLAVVLKTAGPPDVAARTLKDAAVLRGAIGTQPSQRNHPAFGLPEDFYSRRPTTRMGVEWEHRKAFYDAAASRQDPERAFPGSAELLSVLEGRRPYMIQCWATQDIRTAVFLKEEIEREKLGAPRFILDAAAEAWKEPELVVRSQVAVVLPPYPYYFQERPPPGRTSDNAFMALESAAKLHALGVPIALSAHGSTAVGASLDRQAGFAIRGGLPFEAALAAVTIEPARMLGVEDRVGSLEAGKDADLVLWSGTPFEPTSRVIGVLVDGRLVLDPRPR